MNIMHTSSDLTFPAKHLGLHSSRGILAFKSKELVFYPAQSKYPEVHIASKEITNFALNTKDTRREEVHPLNAYYFGFLAFLFPVKSGELSITVTIQTATLEAQFLVDEDAIKSIRSKIDSYLEA